MATYQSDAWALLADASRRAIIERLSSGPCTVADLADQMPISRPAVSQHLKLLKDAGVLRDSVRGRNRVYSIDAQRLARYRRQLDQFWSGALGNLAASTETPDQERDRMSVEADGSVRHERVIDLLQGEAFALFTDLDRFKPREHNMLAVPIERTVMEQEPGGAIYDRGVDGTTCQWGRVVAFDPPDRLVFTWNIGPDWQVTSDSARVSEVEVIFSPESGGRTRVTLVHRHIDRHGDGWESLRSGLDAPDGWPVYLDRYAALTDATGGTP